MSMKQRKSSYNQFLNLSSKMNKLYFFITNRVVTNKAKYVNSNFNYNNNCNTNYYIYYFTISLSIVSVFVAFLYDFCSKRMLAFYSKHYKI